MLWIWIYIARKEELNIQKKEAYFLHESIGKGLASYIDIHIYIYIYKYKDEEGRINPKHYAWGAKKAKGK